VILFEIGSIVTLQVEVLHSNEVIDIDVDLTDTVAQIKEKLFINKLTSIPVDDQTLIFEGYQLSDNLLLSCCNIHNNSRLKLVQPLRNISKSSVRRTSYTLY